MGFLEKFGIKKSALEKLLEKRKELEKKRALNIDKLEEVREQIGVITEQIRTKKQQMDLAGSEEERMIRREIARLFSRIDSFSPKEGLLDRNVRVIEDQIAKIDQIEVAVLSGVDEDTVDWIALEAEGHFERLGDVDEAIKESKNIRYEPPKYDSGIDVDERLHAVAEDDRKRQKKQSEKSAMDRRLEDLLGEEE